MVSVGLGAMDHGRIQVQTVHLKAVGATWSYLELLEQSDELRRIGVLLTPLPSAAVRNLRRWFGEQMAAQLQDGAAPTPPA